MINVLPVIEGYSRGKFEIDFSSIALTQLGNGTLVINGCGCLEMGSSGNFSVKFYADIQRTDVQALEQLISGEDLISGELVPDTHYFSFEGVDYAGVHWLSDKCSLGHRDGYGTSMMFRLAVSSIEAKSKFPPMQGKSALVMRFLGDFEFPYFQTTEGTVSGSDGQTLRSWSHRDSQTFAVGDLQFEIRREEQHKDWTKFSVVCPLQVVPTTLKNRVEETLSLLMAGRMKACIVEETAAEEHIVRLSPPYKFNHGFLRGSVPSAMGYSNEYWGLFQKYFLYVFDSRCDDFVHPLSLQLSRIYIDGRQNLEVFALLLGVAVEGVLNLDEFTGLGLPDAETCKAIDALLNSVDTSCAAKPSLAPRFRGAISAMKRPRAKDKLLALKANGIIDETMYKAWDKLRNSSAHAASLADVSEVDQLIQRCHIVYEVINRLVCYLVCYRGRKINYAKPGWPVEMISFPAIEKVPASEIPPICSEEPT
jgi:hypothetical protein